MQELDSNESTIPAEPQFRYVVGVTRTFVEDVAAYYDVVVKGPAGTAEETITVTAREVGVWRSAPRQTASSLSEVTTTA